MSEALPRTLEEWLAHQLRVHPQDIALGLDRVREVWQRLGAPQPAPIVVTVGGTNGKGSTVALLEAMLAADGRRVGAFTSPHLLRYNERVRVAGDDADDATLIDAFQQIEMARTQGEPVALTYFEYGTLAALWVFAQAGLDVAVLEVGLGGRLDAVNLIDADAAIVTTIDLDHQDWLGNDLDSIGREKAGIFRRGRPAIVGDPGVPSGLLDAARGIGADVRLAGRDFDVAHTPCGWRWSAGDTVLDLPPPRLAAPVQYANAAAAIAALHALRGALGWNPRAIAQGVAQARIGARLQRFAGTPEIVVDVGHNPQAARALADWLRLEPAAGRTLAVFGALGDKDVRGVVAALAGHIDEWLLAGLERDSPRGLDSARLHAAVASTVGNGVPCSVHADVDAAMAAACTRARPGDRVLVFGSFFVAAAALRFAARRVARRIDHEGRD